MEELMTAALETLEMTVLSLVFSYLIAIPLGIITNETNEGGLFENKIVNFILNVIIGFGRAVPFTILMVLSLPLTRLLIGTGIGTTATVVPLTLAAVPFVARTLEQSLDQCDSSIVEAGRIDGISNFNIIFRIKLGSRMFDIVNSIGLTSVAIISYTAMAGAVGGGGLGNYALTHGFYRYDWNAVMLATIIIVVIVCVFQFAFKALSKLFDWRAK